MEILIIIALVLINGIFAMSEMALVSSRKFKLENAKKKGIAGASTALELSENPTKFLSTVQIGITLIGVLLGVYSGENLKTGVITFLEQYEFFRPFSKNIATGLLVLFITYISIVLGELFPKRLGMTFPETIAIMTAKPMKIISIITSPFVWLLTQSNNILLSVLGIKKTTDSKVSEEEIKSIIKESADGGEIQEIEQSIVERVFELGDRKVKSLYTHRSDIVFFTIEDTFEEIKRKINEEKHSAYPVSKTNDLDDIIGVVLLKDLFIEASNRPFDIEDYIKKPIYLNENTFAYNVLEIFKKEKMHYGIVVDEYGGTIGIVTMDDVVDALVGDVTEDNQEEYSIVQRDEKSWLLDGQFSIIDFCKYFNMDLDELYDERFTTIAGLILFNKNTIPDEGDTFEMGDFKFEILDKDGQRIDKILLTKK